MKASFIISIVSALATTTLAASCDVSNAIDVTPYLEELSKSNGGGGSLIDDDYFYRIIDNAVKRRVKRATLDCMSSETCVALQGFPLCFDAIAYTWRDAAGDNGNLKDGSYTLADGRKGNLYTGPYPLPDGSTATPTGATPTNNNSAMTETPNVSAPTTSSGMNNAQDPAPTTGGSTTSPPSASQTPNGGVKAGLSIGLAIAVFGGALAALV